MIPRTTLDSRSVNRYRRLAIGAVALALGLGHVASPAGVAGEPPARFRKGKVTTPFGEFSRANAVALQTDGKIVVAGHSASGDFSSGFDYDFAVARYNADGSLDTTFDTDGKVTTDFGTDYDAARAVAIQPSDGKIVVAGSSYFDMALARYDTSGIPDPDFGTDGKVTIRINFNCAGTAVAIQPSDGKIIVAGNGFTGSGNNFALARFNTDGTPDDTFGDGGTVSVHFTTLPVEFGNAMVLQENGQIVVAGQAYSNLDGTLNDFLVARYDSDGSVDESFGPGGGFAQINFNLNEEAARAVALQRDGKILVAGFTYQNNTGDFALARLDVDGILDPTFGVEGKQTTDFDSGPGNGDQAAAIMVQPGSTLEKDMIILAGGAFIGTGYDFALARYKIDGSLDKRFGNKGKRTTSIGPGDTGDSVAGLVRLSNRKVVAVGGSGAGGGSSTVFALVRYKVQ